MTAVRCAASSAAITRRLVSIRLCAVPILAPRWLAPAVEQIMKVDESTVRTVARLARIRVSDEEAKALEGELTAILDWVEQLEEVETDGVQTLSAVNGQTLQPREDTVTDGGVPDRIVANAPLREDHFFAVPKVVE